MPVERLNGIDLYYEVLGEGPPLICMGGWGTFCHGGVTNLPRGITDRYKVVIFDYRGIGESGDDGREPTMALYAEDAIALLDHLGLKDVHLMGLVGMGACVCQEIAIRRPDLARSMLNMGAWAEVDTLLGDQLEIFRDVHREMGFLAFQKLVAMMSFTPEYYNENKDKLLGPKGAWGDLNGRYEAHARLIAACLSFNAIDRLGQIACPTLIIHAGLDVVTSPRTTIPIEKGIPNARGLLWDDVAHVVAGKEQKMRFAQTVFDWLAEN